MRIEIVNQTTIETNNEVIKKVLLKASSLLQLRENSITIILVDNEEIKRLNKQFRNKDDITDVLTFPDGYLHHLGDVFISLEKCDEQAQELGHSTNRELGFLTVHGLLHTLGYDHHTEEEEKVMFDLQENILHKAKLYR